MSTNSMSNILGVIDHWLTSYSNSSEGSITITVTPAQGGGDTSEAEG